MGGCKEVKEAVTVLVFASLWVEFNVGIVLADIGWLRIKDVFKAFRKWRWPGLWWGYVRVMFTNFPSQEGIIYIARDSISWEGSDHVVGKLSGRCYGAW